MFKNALVSVSDKSKLNDFLNHIVGKDSHIVSTGGTAKYLEDNKFKITPVENWTGHPEVMDGRVKTLHPNVHMCLLYRDQDSSLLEEKKLTGFDLVIGNLYPFTSKPSIETIDIGGPSFLRAAAKNYEKIIVLCDPDDYEWVASKKLELSLDERKYLAAKVFRHTSVYDANISSWLEQGLDKEPKQWSWGGNINKKLRYGENPSQKAFYVGPAGNQASLLQAEVLQGKELSYNNILDLAAAIRTLNLFDNNSVAIAVKHNNPCGVAVGKDANETLGRCLKADPKSVFGGIIALNNSIDGDQAEQLSEIFLECIVAPDISDAAMQVFAKKKNLRILKWPELLSIKPESEFRSVLGGALIQSTDTVASSWSSDWKVHGEAPDDKMKEELLFAWKLCAALKSNAIAISSGLQSLGMGMGQVNRVDAVEHAISRAEEFHKINDKAVLASDAFFPFEDSVERIHQAGIRWIIQPGGSIRDEQVIATAKKHGINMVLTGQRHFYH